MNFIDLKQQYNEYKEEINKEIENVLESAYFIMGPVLERLEKELSSYIGVKHAIGCSSGTDALLLALLAKEIKPGDEIIVPDFTFIAAAEVVSLLHAKPVFVDIDKNTYNLDYSLIEKKITKKTRGIIAVSLYGQCADYNEINAIAEKHNLFVIEDAAQSFGAFYKNKKSGNLTELATTSFYPAKPLGAYGDGGAVFTNDDSLADKIRMILNHGQSKTYQHKVIGINGRLDAIQAAILIVKLHHFDDELKKRQIVANWYSERLKELVKIPIIKEGNSSVWAQYTVRSNKRDEIIENLKEKEIPVAIHYPIPLHKQEAFAYLQENGNEYPISTKMTKEVFSLPMHPFLSEEDVDTICKAIKDVI